MMISEQMNSALNKQVANELNTSFAYLAMAFELDDMGLKIFGERFVQQSDEEREHAMKITGYLQDVGGKVVLSGVDTPRSEYGSARSMVEAALESEKTVTRQINDLVSLAESEKDYATRSFLQWYVDEQVEEVSSMSELLQMVEMAGESNLFLVENRLAKMMKQEQGKE
ncbi:MAG: ferritin [Phycisphaerales bacterium]|nr:ferritin [Phycisphaerales bacterium]